MAYFALATIASMSSWLLSIEQTFYIKRQPLTLSTAGGAANAAPLLEMEGMGDRVVHRVGDASIDDFGVETFDLVYTSNLVHHLVDEENRDLTRRVARALRPGGHYVIVDSVRPRSAKEAGQIGTLGDLFFALTSRAATWSFEEMADWQRSAGLEPRRPIRLRTGPGVGIQWP
jgi:SAM-dependent methyltransferase